MDNDKTIDNYLPKELQPGTHPVKSFFLNAARVAIVAGYVTSIASAIYFSYDAINKFQPSNDVVRVREIDRQLKSQPTLEMYLTGSAEEEALKLVEERDSLTSLSSYTLGLEEYEDANKRSELGFIGVYIGAAIAGAGHFFKAIFSPRRPKRRTKEEQSEKYRTL